MNEPTPPIFMYQHELDVLDVKPINMGDVPVSATITHQLVLYTKGGLIHFTEADAVSHAKAMAKAGCV